MCCDSITIELTSAALCCIVMTDKYIVRHMFRIPEVHHLYLRRPRKLAGGLGGQGREAKAPKKKKGGPAVPVLPPPDDRYLLTPFTAVCTLWPGNATGKTYREHPVHCSLTMPQKPCTHDGRMFGGDRVGAVVGSKVMHVCLGCLHGLDACPLGKLRPR